VYRCAGEVFGDHCGRGGRRASVGVRRDAAATETEVGRRASVGVRRDAAATETEVGRGRDGNGGRAGLRRGDGGGMTCECGCRRALRRGRVERRALRRKRLPERRNGGGKVIRGGCEVIGGGGSLQTVLNVVQIPLLEGAANAKHGCFTFISCLV
jgi:hypothetical protein